MSTSNSALAGRRNSPISYRCYLIAVGLFTSLSLSYLHSLKAEPLIPAASNATGESIPKIVIQSGHRDAIYQVAVSPDKTRLATVGGGEVKVWTPSGSVVWSASVAGDARCVAWSPDGRFIAVGVGGVEGFIVGRKGDSAGAQLRNAQDGTLIGSLLHGNNTVSSLTFLPNDLLRVNSGEGGVLWNLKTLQKVEAAAAGSVARLRGQMMPSPNGKFLAKIDSIGLQIWDGSAQKKLFSHRLNENLFRSASWAPDSRHLAVFDGFSLRVWKMTDNGINTVPRVFAISTAKEQFAQDSPYRRKVYSVAWSGDGKRIAVAATWWPDAKDDPEYGLIEGMPRTFVRSVSWPVGNVSTLRAPQRGATYSLAALPGARLVRAGSTPAHSPDLVGLLAVYPWEKPAPKISKNKSALPGWIAAGYTEAVNDIALSPDGRYLAVGGEDTAVRIWDWQQGVLKATLKRPSKDIVAIAWSSDGSKIAALDLDNLTVWDVAKMDEGVAKAIKVWPGLVIYEGGNNSVAWSPDNNFVAASSGGGVKVWNLQTGQMRRPATTVDGMISSLYGPVHWGKSGLRVGLSLLNPQTFQPGKYLSGSGLGSERGHNGVVQDFDFFDDEKRLVTVGAELDDRTMQVKLWDVGKDVIDRTIRVLPDSVYRAKVAPDGKTLAVADKAGGVTLVDLTSLEVIWRHDIASPASGLAWSQDGNLIFMSSIDGRISLLSSQGELQATFLKLPQRPLLAPGTNIMDRAGMEWLSWTPDGHYASSDDATKHIRWRQSTQLFLGQTFIAHKRAKLSFP